MSDRYRAQIRVWPWPTDLTPVQAAAEWVTEEFGEIEEVDEPLVLFTPYVDRRRILTLGIEEACDGVDEFLEPRIGYGAEQSFIEALRTAGLSFVAFDVGGEGRQGRELSWKEGLAELRERPVLPGSAIALPEDAAVAMLADRSSVEVADQLRNYFAPLEEFVEPTD